MVNINDKSFKFARMYSSRSVSTFFPLCKSFAYLCFDVLFFHADTAKTIKMSLPPDPKKADQTAESAENDQLTEEQAAYATAGQREVEKKLSYF